jgi:hypothetical protein
MTTYIKVAPRLYSKALTKIKKETRGKSLKYQLELSSPTSWVNLTRYPLNLKNPHSITCNEWLEYAYVTRISNKGAIRIQKGVARVLIHRLLDDWINYIDIRRSELGLVHMACYIFDDYSGWMLLSHVGFLTDTLHIRIVKASVFQESIKFEMAKFDVDS